MAQMSLASLRARTTRAGLLTALAALLPWSWFLWRDGFRLPLLGRTPPRVVLEGVAVLLPVLVAAGVAAVLVLAGLRRRPGPVVVAASLALFGVVAVVLPWRPRPGPRPVDPVRVLVANARFDNDEVEAAAADITGQDGDVVVVPEVPPELHERLSELFPSALRAYGGPRQGAVGVYSRWPLDREERRDRLMRSGAFRLVVDGPAGPFVLYAVHFAPLGLGRGRVGPAEQERMIERLRRAVAEETGPVVVAGDLNVVDRSPLYRRLTDVLDDATTRSWRGPTSLRWRVLLARIDHVLVSEDWCGGSSGTYSVAGSDHRGVSVEVGPCPGQGGSAG